MNPNAKHRHWLICKTAVFIMLPLLMLSSAFGQASICAQVKIQILQQLTLERQAFQAQMTINNGLAGVPLTSIGVNVTFADQSGNYVRATSDPNDLTAKFFIRLQTGSSIPATIPGNTTSTTTWLIIPTIGAAGSNPQGTLYSVGATLTYISGGQSNVVQVSPATINVLPLPNLALDYFLPDQVYGDDPFTDNFVEPEVPFSLGVRVKNSGYGPAHNLAIQSAQPQIIDNKLGLLVSFLIRGSEVNGQPATPSLLASFGDIQPNHSGVGRWIMTSSLSGRFISFTASFTHADDLGGRLTSLISNVTTHVLVKDVLVDLPGRDNVRDFLALDGNTMRVYESQNADNVVADKSGNSSIGPGASGAYTITTAPSSGFSYIKLADPLGGQQDLLRATRADGKAINTNNAWLSKTYDVNGQHWNYFVNVFDVNNTPGASYTLQYVPSVGVSNRPPHLYPVSDWTISSGNYLSFPIIASDPDGNSLSYAFVSTPPSGATLNPTTGFFQWQPTQAQSGSTNIFTVQVTDNGTPSLSDTGSFTVIVKGNTAPVLTNLPDLYVNVLEPLTFKCRATDTDVPTNILIYTLEPGAPQGARLNPTNGIFSWTPTRDQARTTNFITVTVTDNGLPPLSDSKTFTAVVNDYLELFLGSTILRVGETGSVPVTLVSSAPITNLDFTVDFAQGRLKNWAIQPSSALNASGFVSNNSQFFVAVAPTNGLSLLGTQQLGQLNFTVSSPQSSAFLSVPISDASGVTTEGTEIPKNILNGGQVTAIGAESLLQALIRTNGQRYIVLYGQPGVTFTVQASSSLLPTGWQPVGAFTLTNFSLPINVDNTNPVIFYRAKQ